MDDGGPLDKNAAPSIGLLIRYELRRWGSRDDAARGCTPVDRRRDAICALILPGMSIISASGRRGRRLAWRRNFRMVGPASRCSIIHHSGFIRHLPQAVDAASAALRAKQSLWEGGVRIHVVAGRNVHGRPSCFVPKRAQLNKVTHSHANLLPSNHKRTTLFSFKRGLRLCRKKWELCQVLWSAGVKSEASSPGLAINCHCNGCAKQELRHISRTSLEDYGGETTARPSVLPGQEWLLGVEILEEAHQLGTLQVRRQPCQDNSVLHSVPTQVADRVATPGEFHVKVAEKYGTRARGRPKLRDPRVHNMR
mmetsp:Transcript_96720/g.230202  ORF Transcript_96720/g.230202 Transcript_96720/m.230202 type:complete len:309 (-) Transcript_96720:164-1090(-)